MYFKKVLRIEPTLNKSYHEKVLRGKGYAFSRDPIKTC